VLRARFRTKQHVRLRSTNRVSLTCPSHSTTGKAGLCNFNSLKCVRSRLGHWLAFRPWSKSVCITRGGGGTVNKELEQTFSGRGKDASNDFFVTTAASITRRKRAERDDTFSFARRSKFRIPYFISPLPHRKSEIFRSSFDRDPICPFLATSRVHRTFRARYEVGKTDGRQRGKFELNQIVFLLV
jgi:hypothetical protein